MNELTKTIIFLSVAFVSVAAAFFGRPGRVGTEAPDEVGQSMFAELTDPTAAQSLEIVDFDEDSGKANEFSVVQRQGLWTIPSHENYPADATENLQAAATMFVDLNVINVASEDKKSHAEYGVVQPETEGATASDGVGKLVRMKDAKGNRLVEIIIGKEVPSREGQRFVRRPGQDRVYTVALDSDKLSTKFEDWVQWDLDQLLEFRNEKMLPTPLLEDEELDSDVLNEMKNALADLKIIDVAAKPDALREGLKGNFEKIAKDRAGQQSLVDRGFYPVGLEKGGIKIASTDGELIAKTNDNVQYELYFGKIAGSQSSGDTNSINRFVMIAANVDLDAIAKPELAEVPELAGPVASEGDEADGAGGDEEGAEPVDPDDLTDEQRAANEARDAVIKANARQQNDYDDKVKKAQDKVDELNFRLADWYYVISEEVYNDLHLSRKDVISAKEGSSESGFGADAFGDLKSGGLEREESDEEAEKETESAAP